jgi:beta-lactamase regulating signal transducer with metallopeptidase domain
VTAWLLTWLWQGTALALAVSAAFQWLPRAHASARYQIWWGALIALAWLGWSGMPRHELPPSQHSSGYADTAVAFWVDPFATPVLQAVVGVWLIIACIKLARILPAIHSLHALKDGCRPLPDSLQDRLPLWRSVRSTGRCARLVVSNRLSNAAVLGFQRPSIALPSSLVETLTLEDLDQIVLHEHAHIQRWDDWSRLLQTLVESTLWIHPATHWISRGINLEREVACDESVVARTGDAIRYARCLSRAAERQAAGTFTFAPGFSRKKRDLFRRVDRVLSGQRTHTRAFSAATVSIGVFAIGIAALQLRAFPLIAEIAPTAGIAAPATVRLEPDAATDIAPVTAKVLATSAVLLEPDTEGERHSRYVVSGSSRTSTGIARRPVTGAVSATATSEAAGSVLDLPTLASRAVAANNLSSDLSGPAAPPAPPATPWRLAASAGASVGTAAKHAGVGLAETFSRAGISVGRSFSRR